MRIYFYAFKHYSNITEIPCPITGKFFVNKLPGEAFQYPSMLPAGEYRLDSRFSDGGKEFYLLTKTYGIVKAKGLHDLKMK